MQSSGLQHASEPVAGSRSTRAQTIVILTLALLLRLVVLWTVLAKFPRGWLYTRGMEMGWLAKSIVDGQGLSSPFGQPTGPSAFVAPGYPLLIALVFRLFGTYSVTSAVVVITAQILLSLATVWLITSIARRLVGPQAAWIAGLVWACSLPLIWIPTIFWDTSIAICLCVGLLELVLRFKDRATLGTWIFLGAYCAVTALINPAMLFVLFVMLGWLAFQQPAKRLLGITLAALTFCLVFSPWPVRNARVFHAFIPLRTTVGFELWMGNRPGATGFLDESLFPSFNAAELQDYKTHGELNYTAHKSELAKQYIAGHPVAFARLTAIRIARYWLGTGAEHGSSLFAVHAALTSIFGLIGLGILFRRRRYSVALLFALPLLLFPIPYYITHAEFRYRLALDPFLTILGAYAVVTLYHRFNTTASASGTQAAQTAHL